MDTTDSTSSLFSSSDDEDVSGEADNELGLEVLCEPSVLSLMLKDDPETCFILLIYLKHYSELLFNWRMTKLAVEACKLISDTCVILGEYHGMKNESVQSRQALLATNNNFHFDFKVIKREWLLSDFTLCSEYSLNYLV